MLKPRPLLSAAALTALTVLAALVFGPSATANAQAVHASTAVTFNSPLGAKVSQDAIRNQIARLIDGAPGGTTISVVMFHFSDHYLADRLVAAKKRKVKVRVVLDWASGPFPAYQILERGLGASKKRTSWVMLCPKNRGCIAPKFNHDKFYVFSRTLHMNSVVVQTSANATPGAGNDQWNDALTIVNRPVYLGFLRYFNDMAAQRRTSNYHRVVLAGKYRVDFLPWASSDPISEALGRVRCSGGTRVRVAMDFLLSDPVARSLRQMHGAGCRIQLVVTHTSAAVVKDLKGLDLRYLPDDVRHPYEHSKFLAIDGWYAGKRQKVVLTGSVNYTGDSFRAQDETLVTAADSRFEGLYAARFQTEFAHARR